MSSVGISWSIGNTVRCFGGLNRCSSSAIMLRLPVQSSFDVNHDNVHL